jgi:hypothetical protein
MSSEALPLGRTRTFSPTGLRSGLGRVGLRSAALIYLGGMIALPLGAVISKGFANGLGSLRSAMAAPGAVAAIRLTIITALLAALINAIFGTLLSFVLVRYRFPGRGVLSAVVDLPFAIPTLVTGVMLVALYGPASPVGGWLEGHGIHIVFAIRNAAVRGSHGSACAQRARRCSRGGRRSARCLASAHVRSDRPTRAATGDRRRDIAFLRACLGRVRFDRHRVGQHHQPHLDRSSVHLPAGQPVPVR